MTILLYSLLAVFLAWHAAPMLYVLMMKDVPLTHRLRACVSFATSAGKSVLILPAILVSPLAVTLALLFTPREANALPSWAQWWDNDKSINGDWPEYWPLDYVGTTYYADAHPRSFDARYIWLVLRNRASGLAQQLGYKYAHGEQNDREHWGDVLTSRSHEGAVLNRCGKAYQLYRVKRVSDKVCMRTDYGYKVWSTEQDDDRAMAINTTVSFLEWQGA